MNSNSCCKFSNIGSCRNVVAGGGGSCCRFVVSRIQEVSVGPCVGHGVITKDVIEELVGEMVMAAEAAATHMRLVRRGQVQRGRKSQRKG